MYEIRLPNAALRPFIECYWFLKATVDPLNSLDELIFIDARADMVFTFGSPYFRIKEGPSRGSRLIRSSNLDAQRRYPVRIKQHGKLDFIGVRFRPGGLSSFVRIPVHQLCGHTISLYDAFGHEGAKLEERLYDAAGQTNVQSDLLDRFFLSRLVVLPQYHRVMNWVLEIERRQGLVSISQISQSAKLSVRSIDRLFRQVIGVPPKFFARTVRFRNVHAQLMKSPSIRWDEIVESYGYVDQSHFTKDVVSMAGIHPQAYRAYLTRPRDSPPPNHVQFLQDN